MSHSGQAHPHIPFDDADFFPPAFQNLFPSPPPIPPSADLFSASEATDFFGFLENFNWDFDLDSQNAPYQDSHFDGIPPASPPSQQQQQIASTSALSNGPSDNGRLPMGHQQLDPRASLPRSEASSSTHSESSASVPTPPVPTLSSDMRAKSTLSPPQKRLNHILSEQKRRNAIREGYLQLTGLLAPAGAPPGSGMPTRGRPKGSGGRGRGSKGKSGILFKAREYIRFLEEGNDALKQEVRKVEVAARIQRT